MRKIGLIGGMSWESTVAYYQIINTLVKEELGGLHSAKLILYSVDFQEIEECQAANDWDKCTHILSQAAVSLERAGADFILICANTMHKVEEQVQRTIDIPLIHVAEAVAEYINGMGLSKIALLGTRYILQEDFYIDKLKKYGSEILLPEEGEIDYINSMIFDELFQGVMMDSSKDELLRIIERLKENGAQGVILGCNEISMLISQGDMDIPVFDTTDIHATKAAILAINSDMII